MLHFWHLEKGKENKYMYWIVHCFFFNIKISNQVRQKYYLIFVYFRRYGLSKSDTSEQVYPCTESFQMVLFFFLNIKIEDEDILNQRNFIFVILWSCKVYLIEICRVINLLGNIHVILIFISIQKLKKFF